MGLTDLFIASGKETRLQSPLCIVDSQGRVLITGDGCANSMGLFLQKTNIIRDFLEDTLEGRDFWPKEVMLYNIIDKLISLYVFICLIYSL